MEDYPRTLTEFEERFSSEDACREYLRTLRWPDGFSCPRCNFYRAWSTDRNLYVCKQCGMHVSLLAGTIFQDTKKPLVMWFRAIWHVTSQKYGANALGIQRIMGFGSYRTAWSWLHKLRRAMIRPGRDRLSGTVQVDETLMGGKKPGKRGRGAEGKQLVLVASQEDGLNKIGRIRLSVIPDASAASINTALLSMVEPGSLIKTDGWTGYLDVDSAGYRHEVIRQRSHVGEDMLPACHRVASLCKRWLLGTLQGAAGKNNLQYYLDEYTFRFNRRTSKSRGKLFYRLIQQAVMIEPVLVKDLKAASKKAEH
jgi:transposase-like protein